MRHAQAFDPPRLYRDRPISPCLELAVVGAVQVQGRGPTDQSRCVGDGLVSPECVYQGTCEID